MYDKSAKLYDLIHNHKDYAIEAEHIHRLIQERQLGDSLTLLDVACGTGHHLHYLREYYQGIGLDLDAGLLAVAREHFPDITFIQDDMRSFDLARTFDVITCVFGAIAYIQTLDALWETCANFARHLKSGGVLVLEPFLQPDNVTPGVVRSFYREAPDMKVARFSTSTVVNNLMTAHYHYLVGSAEGIDYFTETHVLGLFSRGDILGALEATGFVDVQSPVIDVFHRGMYVATRS